MVQRAIRRCAISAVLIVAIPAQAAVASSAPTVHTQQGVVRGFTADGADKFLGLPYAAPPVGALRWRAPQPAAHWHGVRSATSYGNRCPQLASSNGAGSENEDCLYLNVFRPAHAGSILSLRSGGATVTIGDDEYGREHNCDLWDAMG